VSAGSADDDHRFMQRALELARIAADAGEVPVGAVLVSEGTELASGWNRPLATHDPSAHAEILALRAGGERRGNYRLPDATIYCTLEPCLMCAGAMIHARIARLVYAAPDPKSGADLGRFDLLQSSEHNHFIRVDRGIMEAQSARLLREFFHSKRG